jgi:selenocysteine lyase/cysteine desulfurase
VDVRGLFPVTDRFAYLNTAAVAPLSTRARDAMGELIGDQCAKGAIGYDGWFRRYDACREAAARLLSATADEIALVANTSAGLTTVAHGLRARPGDNVVVPAAEFPANVYPWMSVPGVEVRRAPKRGGRLLAEDVAALVDGRTRAVSVSFVDWLTGHRPDLRAIGEAAHAQGALFVVDAIQGLGALALDAPGLGIDALAADGHKWLCGPEGAAILYVRREARERIAPTAVSWLSVRHPTRFLEYDLAPAPCARRYEGGTPNTAGIFGLHAAIELILETGAARIEAHVLRLARRVREGARERGLGVACDADADAECSGIVGLRVRDAPALAASLDGRGVIVAAREGLLRVATHFFNDEGDVGRLLEALDEAACASS